MPRHVPSKVAQGVEVGEYGLWLMSSCGNGQMTGQDGEGIEQYFIMLLGGQRVLLFGSVVVAEETGPFADGLWVDACTCADDTARDVKVMSASVPSFFLLNFFFSGSYVMKIAASVIIIPPISCIVLMVWSLKSNGESSNEKTGISWNMITTTVASSRPMALNQKIKVIA